MALVSTPPHAMSGMDAFALGNIVGGALLVVVVYRFVYLRKAEP